MNKISDDLVLTKNLKSRNRIMMPSMETLMAKDGLINDFHVQHYGARAYGGVGMIVVESTGISEEGKIRDTDLAIYNDEQIEAFKRVTSLVKAAKAIVGVQILHAGSKSMVTTKKVFGPTDYYAYLDKERDYRTMNARDLETVKKQFVKAAKNAKKAGFDFVELHGGHGYLINQLLHPNLNQVFPWKNLEERMAFLIEIIDKINTEVKIPVGIRLSITDHDKEGVNEDYYKPLIKALSDKVIYFNLSSGVTVGRVTMDQMIKAAGNKLFRLPLAVKVKKWTKTPIITGGNVASKADVNEMLAGGIDGVFIAREILYNPNLVLNTLLEVEEITDEKYHWNNNPWYHPRKYLELMKALKLK